MNHRDAEITEVVVILHSAYSGRLADAAEKLKQQGMEIFSTDTDEGVISGSIETYKVAELEKLDCVNYVRSVMTYIADYPVGDPRDRDLREDDDEDTAEAV